MKKIECIVDSTVSETYNQPEGNDAVTWGFFPFFFSFFFSVLFFRQGAVMVLVFWLRI